MEKISVSIRVRPLEKQEAAKGSLWKINNNAITLCSASGAPLPNQVYIFDHVFGTDSTTLDIYKATTKDIVRSAVKGFNGTVFAYGQTSSGKTFTMRGMPDMPGIIPLAIHDVFKNLEEAVDREFLLRMSYMEIYNEDINDLLAPEQTKLQVHESLERGIFVAGLREEIVVNPEQVLQLMDFGEAHRHIGETNMNVHSSRSHTIFRMVIESRDKSHDDSVGFSCDAVRVSVLNLVDLAGSERVAKTGAEGARLKEGTHINKSLMVLGTVINKLSEGIQNQGGHVPYRDSKLTRILQPALGGNARTAVICNITPAAVHVDESRGTLQFASRAIRVTNCAQVNEILTDAALLKRQKKEIEELRSKLKESHSEHLEEEILTLRNTLLKSECERERIALELQEEKRAHAERERKQAQKIENLSTLVLNSTVDERDFEKRLKKNTRRETWCPRITTGNILDEDVNKPLKEDRWVAQSRDRLFPMPPPFESLLEEDESFNERELTEVREASPQHQDRHCADNDDKDLNGSFGPLPDPSVRIHVADRKRKYCGMPSVRELTDNCQMSSKDCEMDKNNVMEVVSSHKESKRGYQSQNADDFDSMDYKDKGDLNIFGDAGMVQANSTIPMAQQLSQELSKARDEIVRYKHQLALTLEELEQLKNQAPMSVKDTDNQGLQSLVISLEKEKEGLAIQLTEAYLQFEEEKAAWAAANRALMGGEMAVKASTANIPEHSERVKFLEEKLLETEEEICAVKSLAEGERLKRLNTSNEAMALREELAELSRELEKLKSSELTKESSSLEEDCCGSLISENLVEADVFPERPEEKLKKRQKISYELVTAQYGPSGDAGDCESMIQEISHLKEKISDLESLLVDLKSEKEENVLELKSLKSKMKELEEDDAAANSIADQERREKEKKALEFTTMEGKMVELETKYLQERALRERESGKAEDLRMKLLSIENLLGQTESESTKEKWKLETENLKLRVSLDAITARAEVFHGRLLEADDELKEVHEELDHLKGLNEKKIKEETVMVEASNIETSVSDAGHVKSVKHVWPVKDQNSDVQLAPCNTAQNSSMYTGKQRIQASELEQMSWSAVGLQGTKVPLIGNLAHTVAFPIRSTTMKRQEHTGVIADGQMQSRSHLSTLNGNAAAGNKVTREVESTPALGKSFVSGPGNQKPPKASVVQKNTSYSKGWPTNIHNNKENR